MKRCVAPLAVLVALALSGGCGCTDSDRAGGDPGDVAVHDDGGSAPVAADAAAPQIEPTDGASEPGDSASEPPDVPWGGEFSFSLDDPPAQQPLREPASAGGDPAPIVPKGGIPHELPPPPEHPVGDRNPFSSNPLISGLRSFAPGATGSGTGSMLPSGLAPRSASEPVAAAEGPSAPSGGVTEPVGEPVVIGKGGPIESEPTGSEPATPQPAETAAPASESNPAVSDASPNGYEEVQVYYATDRQALDAANITWWTYAEKFLLTAICAAVAAGALLLSAWGLWKRLTRGLGIAAGAACVVLGLLATNSSLQLMGDLSADGRVYGGGRGEGLELGVCRVSIPQEHRVGELEAPSILKLEFSEDARKHVVLLETELLPPNEFYTSLSDRVQRSERNDVFVFVHGYNVSFEAAARRTGQLAYDLHFEGAPIMYSWPSQAAVSKYTVDENNVEWTVPHLKEFLREVVARSGAQSVHLVAHSMGNRALTKALKELSYELQAPVFNEVVLTAPDIDAGVFKQDIAPRIVKTARRVTLYASSNDEALKASKKVHGFPRAGESGSDLVVLPGLDTIDVSDVDSSLLGHSYYGSNQSVLADLAALLCEAADPPQRTWLQAVRREDLVYWVFQPEVPATARFGSGLER